MAWRVLVVAILLSGCADTVGTRFVAPIVGGRAAVGATRMGIDEEQCASYASARPSEIRYATYVACLVSRGYRTYASLVGYRGATGVTVEAQRDQMTSQVFRDLTACAAEAKVRVDMPPHDDMFQGTAGTTATQRAQAPFAQCLDRSGYSTTLHATPSAAMTANAIAVTPPAPGTIAERAPIIVPAPSPPPTPSPVSPAPATANPSTPTASAPPASRVAEPAPRIATVPTSPSERMGRPVKLGLYVDPATSPPVVAVVASDTPAGRAGVRPGDVVLRIDTAVIRSENDITGALASKRPGDVVRIDLQRGQRHVTVDATLVAP